MMAEDAMAEKKLRGSGGYAIARITDEEQKKGNLGGPELFLAGIGRLEDARFVKYHCNKCEKEYEGAPSLFYDNPNEDIEGVTLVEKGEYKCKTCNSTIAQYRKFDTPSADQGMPLAQQKPAAISAGAGEAYVAGGDSDYLGIQSLVGMSAYDSNAMLIGKIEEIGLRRSAGTARITIKIGGREVHWDGISKIGDIVLLRTPAQDTSSAAGKCQSCGYQNDAQATFCAECGTRL